ncbi:MAG TPA: hypothetical protein VLZ81_12540, partial [Blastocatellia bacterium]|nr:hypothetical protein [Blastocatellia bacterium]
MDQTISSMAIGEEYSDTTMSAMWADRILSGRARRPLDLASDYLEDDYRRNADAASAVHDLLDDESEAAPQELEKTEDLVCVYLREMGMTPMLSRDSEIRQMQRMERGRNKISKSLSRSPVAIEQLIELGDLLRDSALNIREVVNVRDGEEITEEGLKACLEYTIILIGEVERNYSAFLKLLRKLDQNPQKSKI